MTSFGLVWSEGSIYIVGFAEGLRRWRRRLRPGGFVAITEATWLTEQPPREAYEFRTAEYPAMTTIEGNLAAVEAAGLEPIGQFALPPADWAGYFDPLLEPLERLRADDATPPPRCPSPRPDFLQAFCYVAGSARAVCVVRGFGPSTRL